MSDKNSITNYPKYNRKERKGKRNGLSHLDIIQYIEQKQRRKKKKAKEKLFHYLKKKVQNLYWKKTEKIGISFLNSHLDLQLCADFKITSVYRDWQYITSSKCT